MKFAYSFRETPGEALDFAGGKGGSLCKMYNAGIAVPNGFVILSIAFENNQLKDEARFKGLISCHIKS
ncbi:MAG TPA: hypothetical protein VM577_09775 [Anaerovoracaceae bacterium]|nr:hypothetical protein [Anaerovoracaceae bacterium]